MKVVTFNLDKPNEDIVRYDPLKIDVTNGFTLVLNNGQRLDLSERDDGVVEIMATGPLGTDLVILPRSANMIAIKPERRR